MTEEQLALVQRETAHAVRKALRLHTRQVVAAYLLILAVLGFTLYQYGKQDDRIVRAGSEGRAAAIKESCKADEAFARAIDRALIGQIQYVKDVNEPPPPTVAQRIAGIQELRRDLNGGVPACEDRLKASRAAAKKVLDGD